MFMKRNVFSLQPKGAKCVQVGLLLGGIEKAATVVLLGLTIATA